MQLPPQLPAGFPDDKTAIAMAASEAGIPNEVIEGLSALATGMAVDGPAGAAVGLAVVVGKWLGDALFGGKSLLEATEEVTAAVRALPPNVDIQARRDLLITYRMQLTSPVFRETLGKIFQVNKSIALIDNMLTSVAPAGVAADVPAIGRERFQQMPDAVLINFINFQTTLLAPAVLAARPELKARAIQDQIFLIQQILEERRLRGMGAVAGFELLPIVYTFPMRAPGEYFGARDAYLRGIRGTGFRAARHIWRHGMDAAAEIVA